MVLDARAADILVAACACSMAAICSAIHIWGHLSNFAEPKQQIQIVRILLMVPIYAILSCCSLSFPEHDIMFDSVRDCYEAFTIYSFFQLLLEYIGGESIVGTHYREKGEVPHPWPCGLCMDNAKLDGRFLRKMKQGVLQFVFIKPALAALTVMLDGLGCYGKDEWVTNEGFLYVQIIYNFSYSWALYALALFYGSSSELLVKHKPIKKFVMVKMIVFVSFWQGFTISLLLNFEIISSDHAAADIQAFLICVEMAFASCCHLIAFPISEYEGLEKQETSESRTSNLADVINVGDVMMDAVNNYAPTYRQYELQTQGANKAQPKSIIARGFVLKEDENLDGTDARVEDPNCIIPRLRSETESSIGQDATERAIRELEESEEQNAGNELVDVNPFSAHSCLDGDTGA